MIPPLRFVAAVPFVLAAVTVSAPQSRQPADADTRELEAHMAFHVAQADTIRRAVVRGDMEAVHAPARELAEHSIAPEFDVETERLIRAMREAAAAAAEAPDLPLAALAAARLAAACGACHRAVTVRSSLPSRARASEIGGVVGHMLSHQAAVDQLHAGLVEPSDALWQRGARALQTAPLENSKFPRDRALDRGALASETRVHQLAERAERATSVDDRVEVYAQLLVTCASCHGIHHEIWGPPRE
jgi:hypothetical protein